MARLFGTDGIRGVANRDLTPDLALAVGRAAGQVLGTDGRGGMVVGRDTRVSGPMLEAALVAGACSAGVDAYTIGIVPTPAVAYLTTHRRADFGAVVSASHNPVEDNGIKFFSADGVKITDEVEKAIEDIVEGPGSNLPVGGLVGTACSVEDPQNAYVSHLLNSLDAPLDGLRVVLDCAFGAAWEVGPRVFREGGAHVIALHAEPDGARINVECGSTSLAALAKVVEAERADLGLAFDGDADRVLAVDEAGHEVDGDEIIAMTALRLHARGDLDNGVVVSTVMANLGFRRSLERRGIRVVTTPVGDRFVAQAMADVGAVLGGEQSGHVIFSRHATTGDGLLTGLKVAEALASSTEPMSRLARTFDRYPQVLVNVRVKDKEALEGAAQLWDQIHAAEEALGSEGRVLVRPSGTESLVRVLVEAADDEEARRTAGALADAVSRHLG